MTHPRFAPEPWIALAAAIVYGWGDPGSARTAVKMVPALALSAFVTRRLGKSGWPVAVGLAWHALGDGLLGGAFLAGLGSFLIGHLFYAAAFLRRVTIRALPRWRVAAILGVAAATVAVLAVVLPRLDGPLAIAVPVYALVLAGMAATAIAGRWRRPLVVVGALLFVVSDACLGLGMFGPDGHRGAGAIVWPTYVAAQMLIATGHVAELGGDV